MDADPVAEDVTGASPIGVAIVDDHPVVIDGVRAWLAAEPRLRALATGDDPDVVLRAAPRAEVVLLDLRLHGRMVFDKLVENERRRPAGGGLHSSTATRTPCSPRSTRGAAAFLAKHEGREHCVATVLAAASDRPYVPPALAGAMVGDPRPDRPTLSDKEREALLLWFQSMSKASVARRMISEHTVKQYVDRARIKYTRAGRPAATKAALLARGDRGRTRPAGRDRHLPVTGGPRRADPQRVS